MESSDRKAQTNVHMTSEALVFEYILVRHTDTGGLKDPKNSIVSMAT